MKWVTIAALTLFQAADLPASANVTVAGTTDTTTTTSYSVTGLPSRTDRVIGIETKQATNGNASMAVLMNRGGLTPSPRVQPERNWNDYPPTPVVSSVLQCQSLPWVLAGKCLTYVI